MGFNITIPNISSTTDRGKLEQIRSYLYQLAEQLNWALNTLESNSGVVRQSNQSSSKGAKGTEAEAESQASFNDVKSLIISSAEIINAYYDKINKKLSGMYVAQSDFGTYVEHTSQEITKTSTEVDNIFTSLQEIIGSVDILEHNLIEVNARIRSGLLDYDANGVPIYGLEIGQKNEIDGEEVFNKYARFTSDRLSFYDQNDAEVAYISDYKLYITHVQIRGSLQEGGYKDFVDSAGGIVTKWVGGV